MCVCLPHTNSEFPFGAKTADTRWTGKGNEHLCDWQTADFPTARYTYATQCWRQCVYVCACDLLMRKSNSMIFHVSTVVPWHVMWNARVNSLAPVTCSQRRAHRFRMSERKIENEMIFTCLTTDDKKHTAMIQWFTLAYLSILAKLFV